MMGLSLAMTAIAFEPRRVRISAASLSRTRLMAALPGLISSLRVAIQPGWLGVRELGPGLAVAAGRAWFLIFCSRPGVSC